MNLHLNVKIHGEVQGVFFRYLAKQVAESLKIFGYARNEPNGTVCIEVEGEEENLKKFLAWCRKGPPAAKVEKVESEFSDKLEYFDDFAIR